MSGELQISPLDRVAPPTKEITVPPPPPKPISGLRTWGRKVWTQRSWRQLPWTKWAAFGWGGMTAKAAASPPRTMQGDGLQLTAGDRLAPPGGEADASPAARADRVKKTWREERWERRRRRRVGEEILGWILVPIILVSLYWATKAGLAAFGTTPTALVQGIKGALGGRI